MRRTMLLVGVLVAAWAAVAVPARATYNARTTADEPQYLLSALSLAEDGDLDIADELEERRFEPFHEVSLDTQTTELEGGSRLSPHDPLLPVLLAPAMGVGGWVAAKLVLAGLLGLLAALLVWVAVVRFHVPTRVAAVVVIVFGASAPLTVYGTQVYPEVPAALAVTVAIALVTGDLTRRQLMGLAAVVIALPWLGAKFVPVAAALVVVAAAQLWRRRRLDDLVGLLVVLGLAGAAYLVGHRVIYGGWTAYATGDHFQGTGELSVVGTDPDYLGRTRRFVGLLVDRSFGLAAWAPLYLLAVPALAALVRRRPAGWPALVVPLVVGWSVATWVALTMHGWWWPGRQVVVVVPCLVLATAWWAARVRAVRPALVVAGLVGLVLWAWLLAEVLAGDLTLIVDFHRTADPVYRVWRVLLPDGMSGGVADDLGHLAWLVALGALAVLGWRSVLGDQDAVSGELADPDVTLVDADRDRPVG